MRCRQGDRYEIWYIAMGCGILIMGFYHIVMINLEFDMGYGLMISEMTVSIRSSSVSIWDTLSLWALPVMLEPKAPPGFRAR